MRAKKEEASVYKLKSTSKKMNANYHHYNDEQIAYVKEKCGHLLYKFGYTNHPTEENPTAFFNFEEHKPEHLAMFNEYKQISAECLESLAKNDGWKGPSYHQNVDGIFPVFDPTALLKVQYPARDWAAKKLGQPAPASPF